MVRMLSLVFGTLFHTAMIACAAYVYFEAVHPFVARKFAPLPFASSPAFRAAGELGDDLAAFISRLR